ncbi:hypothetical protein OSB04_un000913 [Centaurea solstitialis]|uniref:Uncharacterized protein n=1 Tax=Centaurea solstitialis TaxID=347529 RepID=A0AA38W264_9ASTR|nr:hypothetical protein OSB04_un000913 [Centaurea solstitialis]
MTWEQFKELFKEQYVPQVEVERVTPHFPKLVFNRCSLNFVKLWVNCVVSRVRVEVSIAKVKGQKLRKGFRALCNLEKVVVISTVRRAIDHRDFISNILLTQERVRCSEGRRPRLCGQERNERGHLKSVTSFGVVWVVDKRVSSLCGKCYDCLFRLNVFIQWSYSVNP